MQQDESVLTALKQVIDPELGINIVDLGLVYGAEIVDENTGKIRVTMTLTTPGCPLGGYFMEQVKEAVSVGLRLDEDFVQVEIVWDPPWVPDMMTDESKAELGMD